MKTFVLFLLGSSALIFAAIGLYFLIAPEHAGSSIGVSAVDANGRTDIRATYGGMVLGIAFLFGWTARSPERFEFGLWAVLFVYAGLALGRGLALILGERLGVMMAVFLVIEIGYAGAALLALRK